MRPPIIDGDWTARALGHWLSSPIIEIINAIHTNSKITLRVPVTAQHLGSEDVVYSSKNTTRVNVYPTPRVGRGRNKVRNIGGALTPIANARGFPNIRSGEPESTDMKKRTFPHDDVA